MRVSKKQLAEIISAHGKWLRDEEGGKRADLSGADLSGADLSGAVTDKKYLQITCIGSRRGTTTYCVDDDLVLCGCWNKYKGGTLEAFFARVEAVYGPEGTESNERYYREYMAAIGFFKAAPVPAAKP